jgi:hypothetical protein
MIALAAFVTFGLIIATPTHADVVQLTSPTQLSQGGAVVDYPEPAGTNLLTPYVHITQGARRR